MRSRSKDLIVGYKLQHSRISAVEVLNIKIHIIENQERD
jgi:hypothetical protein